MFPIIPLDAHFFNFSDPIAKHPNVQNIQLEPLIASKQNRIPKLTLQPKKFLKSVLMVIDFFDREPLIAQKNCWTATAYPHPRAGD